MLISYIKFFFALLLSLGLLALLFTLGAIFLVVGVVVIGALMAWYRFKYRHVINAARENAAKQRQQEEDVIETEYTVVQSEEVLRDENDRSEKK